MCTVGYGTDTTAALKFCEGGGLRNTLVMEQTCTVLVGKRQQTTRHIYTTWGDNINMFCKELMSSVLLQFISRNSLNCLC